MRWWVPWWRERWGSNLTGGSVVTDSQLGKKPRTGHNQGFGQSCAVGCTPEYSVSSPCSRRYTAFRRQWRWSQWWTGSIQRRSLGRSVVVSGRGFCDGRKIHDARIVGCMEVGCWGSYPGYSSRKFSCDVLRCLRQKPYNAMNGILFFDEDSLCSAVSPQYIGQYSDRCTRLRLLVRFINRSNSLSGCLSER